jgi:hypothetical protein
MSSVVLSGEYGLTHELVMTLGAPFETVVYFLFQKYRNVHFTELNNRRK